MEKSDEINELAKALSVAQGEIDTAKKDSDNPFFKSKYADLASVWEACRASLAKNGLSVVQFPSSDPTLGVVLTTMLMHSSGQWISSKLSVKPAKADAQSMGSVITYLRRYTLAACVGVASTEPDDDGNAGSHGAGDKRTAIKPPKEKGQAENAELKDKRTISLAQKGKLEAMISNGQYVDRDAVKLSFGVEHLMELKMADMDAVMSYIKTGKLSVNTKPMTDLEFAETMVKAETSLGKPKFFEVLKTFKKTDGEPYTKWAQVKDNSLRIAVIKAMRDGFNG